MKFIKIPGKDFEMAETQTTQGDWCFYMPTNPSRFIDLNNPVEMVSFNDVQEYIKKLNDLKDGYAYRLPTEEEWEFCCRASSTTEYCFGDSEDKLKDYAWFCHNSDDRTHPVATKKPNAFGLYDMHGNVYEWCNTLHDSSGSSRVLRGGSWYSGPRYLRSTSRDWVIPALRGFDVGFRLCRVRNSMDEKFKTITLPTNPLPKELSKDKKIAIAYGFIKRAEKLLRGIKDD